MNNNYLQHYGVLGMKWGVRRRSKWSEDHTTARNLKKKKLNQLSNAELRKLNERMQLEQNYKNLKRQNVSSGRKFIGDVGREITKEVVKESVKGPAKKLINKGAKHVGDYIKTNGSQKIGKILRETLIR